MYKASITNLPKTMHALTSPRMRTRRAARIYIFPWLKLVCAITLSIFGWRIHISGYALFVYVAIILLSCIAEDLAARQSRIMRLLCLWKSIYNKLCQIPRRNQHRMKELLVFFTCHPPPFFAHRHSIRWLFSLIALLANWGFALVQAAFYPAEITTTQLIFTLSLFSIGLVPYAEFLISPQPRWIKAACKRWVWYILGVLGPLATLFSLQFITTDTHIIFFNMILFFFLYTAIFAIQRLWIGQKVLDEIIRDTHQEFLRWPRASQKIQHVPQFLASRLKLDRVFILQPTADEQSLCITAEFGDHSSVLNKQVPVGQSLTGRAFSEKQSFVWNNVDACPYYHSIIPKDDTKAEMAIPILYQGSVYGILDIQSKVKGAYSPGDMSALETVASILGAAIAVDKREQFFRNAIQMWLHIMATKTTLATEYDVFDLFAEFVQKQLGADLIIYYPLSLAGYPVRIPFIHGQFKEPNLLRLPINDPHSSLIQLVADWKPYFEPRVTTESLVTQFSPPSSPGFVERENIYATCFLPVGVHQERLGALFLNFRQPEIFDDTFQFTVLSLAQSLAQATAQVRYRDVIHKSFGRPEINVHSIIGRYGFKKGVMAHTRGLHSDGKADCCQSIEDCKLFPFITQVEAFVSEMRLAESAHPPDFWEESLERQLKRFKSALPNSEDSRRPRLKLNIDNSVEKEYPLIKLALYRVITESISNAIIHGETSRIRVSVQRKPNTIEAEIVNNGCPLPKNAENEKGTNGIYTLLHECTVKLGANARVTNRQDSSGVIVRVAIPALPQTKRRK